MTGCGQGMAALTPTLFKGHLYWKIGKELNRLNWVGDRVYWGDLLQSSTEEGPRGFNIDGIFRRQVWILLFSGVSQFCSGGNFGFWICGEWVKQIIADLGGQCVVWEQQSKMQSWMKRNRSQICSAPLPL